MTFQPLLAATDASREFDQLTLERNKALDASAEGINRRYQTALEALMRRATQANDLDTALKIKQTLEKLSTTPSAALVTVPIEVAGTWRFKNYADGYEGIATFNSDNTYNLDGKYHGKWEIKDKQLVISYDNRNGLQDRYDLPIHDGKLTGANTHGQKMAITRKSP